MTDHGCHYLQPVAALLIWACGEAPVVPQAPAPAAVMVGEWRYAKPAPVGDSPSLNVGRSVTIAIDSAAGLRFFGRVVAWFVGDVGLPRDRFGAVTGTVDEGDRVTLGIAGSKAETPPHTISGRIENDAIVVLESWVGPDVGPFPFGGRFQRLH